MRFASPQSSLAPRPQTQKERRRSRHQAPSPPEVSFQSLQSRVSSITLDSIPIAAEHNHHCAQNNLQIKHQRPVFNVKKIQLHHFFKRQTVSAGYLPQSRESRLHIESFAMTQLVGFNFIG